MDVLFNASYVYTDEQYATLPNNNGEFSPAHLLPDYGLLNASVAMSFKDDTYRVMQIVTLVCSLERTSKRPISFLFSVPKCQPFQCLVNDPIELN